MAGSFACRETGTSAMFLVSNLASKPDDRRFFDFSVIANLVEGIYTCHCKMFEHIGIPCRHMIKVRLTVSCVSFAVLYVPHLLI
jgi:hypothetical protein